MPSGVYERTSEMRRRRSEAMKGKPLPQETREKAAAALRGRPVSAETRAKIAKSNTGKTHSAEARQKMSEAKRGKKQPAEVVAKRTVANKGKKRDDNFRRMMSERTQGLVRFSVPAAGGGIETTGYRYLTGMRGHPLADSNHTVFEHRKVLYDEIGPGPHLCHWGCGETLDWGGLAGLQVDHLNADKLDNDIGNLVPSCGSCNRARAKAGNPIEWQR